MNLPFDVLQSTRTPPVRKEHVMKIGRPRIHKNAAARQSAYRLRLAERQFKKAKAVLRRARS